MEETVIQKPGISPNDIEPPVNSDPESRRAQCMLSGLNLKNLMILTKSFQAEKPAASSDSRYRQDDSCPEDNNIHSVFYGQHLFTPDVVKQLKNYISLTEAGLPKKPPMLMKPASPEICFSKILTADVIASLIKVKKNKRVKVSTLTTYKKRLRLFQQHFPYLPENPEAIMDYLSRFDGESGRHRRNQQDLLNMLYDHAIHRFGLTKNPVAELERPLVTHKPVKTFSLEQIRVLNQTPENLQERTALDLFLGHGWRQIETRRVRAKDVTAIDHQLILCHGKERQELTPVLPETADRLREMAQGLEPDDFLFVARQTRHGRRAPLGEDGMSQLIGRLLARAGIKGFTGQDLRRTFATQVTTASHDEFLAMRLIRDRVPGQSDRYVRYPMTQLVEALQKYSPVRQAEEITQKGYTAGADSQKVSAAVIPKTVAVETVKEPGGDGGESNSPSRRSCPGHTTGLVSSLILPGSPQLTELSQASR